MRHISDLHIGRVNPRNLHFDLDVEPKKLDLPVLVQRLAHTGGVPEAVREIEPSFRLYRKLKETLVRYRELARDPAARTLPPARVVRPGDSYAGVPALRRLLVALGDLPAGAAPGASGTLYDAPLAAAVERFQRRHGLAIDGVIGEETLRQLNVPLATRVRQIELALERIRWLPELAARSHLIVNIPEFKLRGVDLGAETAQRLQLAMNVIVGKAVGTQTPIFHGDMHYVIFRPYWNCPRSIAVKEVAPRARRDPGYLETHHMELVDHFSWEARVYKPTPENIARLASGVLQVRQTPGPHNALGPAKFIFPNSNNVYLHGTPAQQLFSRTRRDFSHGCIRVEDPAALAEYMLERNEGWTRQRIDAAMQAETPARVDLAERIPVYLIYTTVVVDFDDDVLFFEDLYGHDARLQAALDAGYPYAP
jgi:murein L,D-transpeptidase YcbB/YkuD